MTLVLHFHVRIPDRFRSDVDLVCDLLKHLIRVSLELFMLEDHKETDASNGRGSLTLAKSVIVEVVCGELGCTLDIMRQIHLLAGHLDDLRGSNRHKLEKLLAFSVRFVHFLPVCVDIVENETHVTILLCLAGGSEEDAGDLHIKTLSL